VPCQNSISGLPSLFSRLCCRPPGMPPRKVAVAVTAVVVMEVAVMAVVATAVVMAAHIWVAAAIVVGISAAVRTSAVVGATPSTTRDQAPCATR
jgi:hypothetical protein